MNRIKNAFIISSLLAVSFLPLNSAPIFAETPASTGILLGNPAVYNLHYDSSQYKDQTMNYKGEEVHFRSYENRVYVSRPAAPSQEMMSIYIPSAYLEGKTINGYTAKTAPIFLPNAVGGYMPGEIAAPSEKDKMSGEANASLAALAHGYVVAAPAIRGRTTVDSQGRYVGKAPALIIDYKAAVRYLRYNKDLLPAGNTDKIISNGTSAGGALSALLGATGNSKDYEPYLISIGAADERDDIFASVDYCPITNLEHADMAYEWIFNGVNEYHQAKMMMPPSSKTNDEPVIQNNRPDNAPADTVAAVEMTPNEIKVSIQLKNEFPSYVNSLHLRDKQGKELTLDENGNGSFADYIKSLYLASAQSALDDGKDVTAVPWLTVRNGKAASMDLHKYAIWATRLKAAPAFDKLDLSSGENDEFGNSLNEPKHFTAFSLKESTKGKAMADAHIIYLMNPMNYIGRSDVTTAPHWRIRHGAKDRDTSMAIPALLALKLENSNKDVNFAAPWDKGHAGDYDLDELFAWIDSIAK